MRLIDADELKNKLSDKDYITYTHEYGDAIPVDWIMSAIDNAPSVEPTFGLFKEMLCIECDKRPLGEFECCIKIKDLIAMLLEFDMNKKATIYTTENDLTISIVDTEEENETD